jgi:glycosyltransferase involved in cell wall biosynthesis
MLRATIGVDARTFDYPDSLARGIGHYALNHLQSLCECRPDWRFICYTEFPEPPAALKRLEGRANVHFREAAAFEPSQVDLVHLCDPMGFHFGYDSPFGAFRAAGRMSLTFYDLIPLHLYFPSWSELMRRLYRRRLAQCIDSGATCLAISAFTAEDLIRHTGIAAERVKVILAGLNTASAASPTPLPPFSDTLVRLGVERPYFLHVGALDPHKNFETTLSAFRALRRETTAQLVVVGDRSGALARTAAQCAAQGWRDVIFTGFIPRGDLENLYRGAAALVCMSRLEGFGFPVLEAMARGCPVIASRAASIPEVAGDAAVLLPPSDAAGLLRAMRELLSDPSRAANMRRKGLARASLFSWERTGQMTLSVWEELLAAPRAPKGRPAAAPPAARVAPPENAPLRVILDISVLGLSRLYESSRTGVFRVVESLARGLAQSPEVSLLFCSTQHLTEKAPDTLAACRRYLDGAPDLQKIPFVAGDLPEADIYHSPFHAIPESARRYRRFLTVHDLIPLRRPELFRSLAAENIRRLFACLDADVHLFCTSRATQEEIHRLLRAGEERVHIVPLAADPRRFHPCGDRRRIEEVLRRYGLPEKRPYFLSLGTIEPRKNLKTVLEAFGRLAGGGAGDPMLVLAGTPGWEVESLIDAVRSDPRLRGRIAFTGFVADEDLAALYSGALAFIYLSLGEGFGLPPLEAMQCGVPVVVSDRPALPEVTGEAAIQLDPSNVEGLRLALNEIACNAELREEMSQRSLKQAARFSWDRFIRKTLDVYRQSMQAHEVRSRPAA